MPVLERGEVYASAVSEPIRVRLLLKGCSSASDLQREPRGQRRGEEGQKRWREMSAGCSYSEAEDPSDH